MKRTISIDFDGTIVEHDFPRIGKLKEGAKEAITALKEHYTIVISSCRTSAVFNRKEGAENPYFEQMKSFLDQNEIPYDRIDLGNEGKVVAVAYIDDRAISFRDNWLEIAQSLGR